MFQKKYKDAMDNINPNENAVEKALNSAYTKKNKNPIKITLVACLSVVLICTSVFAAFRFGSGDSNHYEGYDQSEENIENGNNIDNNQADNSLLQYGYKYADSYDEILVRLKNNSDNLMWEEDAEIEEDILDNSLAGSPEAAPEGNAPEHSDTNNQVSGVQEGDIVKTDGRFIYHLSVYENIVYISSAENGVTMVLSKIAPEDLNTIELLLIGDTLVIIGEYYTKEYNTEVICVYYDISDRSAPIEKDRISQSGYYQNCRVVDETVYLITQKWSYWHGLSSDDIKQQSILPEINGDVLGCENLLMSDDASSSFTVISAYNATKNELTSELALLGHTHTLYCSKDNIYIASTKHRSDAEEGEVISMYDTKVLRIQLNGGKLNANGVCIVNGMLNNQFSIDEKDGILRIATTITPMMVTESEGWVNGRFEDTYSKVFCIDSDMKIIGESDKLGVTETIKSVRFMGDVVYVVTFRQTDPLYAIDLTDPTNPKTLSELKIDGFSAYMQSYGSDYLVGIGHEANPETGILDGIKLTMFDISDPTDVFDVSTMSYKWTNGYAYSDALYNHKAVLIDYNKGIIGIPIVKEYWVSEPYDSEPYDYKMALEYTIFNFDGDELSVAGSFNYPIHDNRFDWNGTRALYIGDYLYIVNSIGIVSVDLRDYSIVQTNLYE